MIEKELNVVHADAPDDKHFKKFVMKEILDKIGFGFGSQQFVNVLLFLSGASLFLVGVVNGLKVVVSALIGILAQEYYKLRGISKRVIGFSGIFFGFSFLLMAFGKLSNSPLIFSIAVILSGISIVLYGDFSKNFFVVGKRKELLEKIAKYGLIVTAVSLFISAILLDKYDDASSSVLNILGRTFVIKMPGYVATFEISAIAFILSGYFLASMKEKVSQSEGEFSLTWVFSNLKQASSNILKNRFLLILIIFNILVGLVQVIGNSYYGIFIYQNYKDSYFGGFLNIAIVFLIGVFSSLLGYFITKMNTKSYGPISMLVAGGLFLSLMPLVYYLGSDLAWLTAGTILGIIGASALGVSAGMLAIGLMNEAERKYFYALNGLFSIVPYLVFVPIFAFAAQRFGLNFLFLILSMIAAAATLFLLFSYILLKKSIF